MLAAIAIVGGAIEQVSGAFFTTVWEGIIRGTEKLFVEKESKQEENKE